MPDMILALILGYGLDLIVGDPEWLYHPVRLIGRFISFAERKLRARGGDLRRSAVILTASTVLVSAGTAAALLLLLGLFGRWPKLVGMALMDWMGIAVTSMAKEARGVKRALDQSLEAGRRQVSRTN